MHVECPTVPCRSLETLIFSSQGWSPHKQTHQVPALEADQPGRLLPADGPEQGGAGFVVEGDDDAGGREVPAIHQQGASGEGKTGDKEDRWGQSRPQGLEPRASQ